MWNRDRLTVVVVEASNAVIRKEIEDPGTVSPLIRFAKPGVSILAEGIAQGIVGQLVEFVGLPIAPFPPEVALAPVRKPELRHHDMPGPIILGVVSSAINLKNNNTVDNRRITQVRRRNCCAWPADEQ